MHEDCSSIFLSGSENLREHRLLSQYLSSQSLPQQPDPLQDGGGFRPRPPEASTEAPKKIPSIEETLQKLKASPDAQFLFMEGNDGMTAIDRLRGRGTDEERLKRDQELQKLLEQFGEGLDRFIRILESARKGEALPSDKEIRGAAVVTDSELELRRELADIILQGLQEEREGLQEANAFTQPEMGALLESIEDSLAQERPPSEGTPTKHPFYLVRKLVTKEGDETNTKNIVYPDIEKIVQAERDLRRCRQWLDKDGKQYAETERRIKNVELDLQTRKFENPPARYQYLAMTMRERPRYSTTLQLATLGLATVAGTLVLFSSLKNKKPHWLLAVYGGIIYYGTKGKNPYRVSAFSESLTPEDRKTLEQSFKAADLVQYEPFQMVWRKVGLTEAVAATEECFDLLQNPVKQTALKRELASGKITLQFLEAFVGEKETSRLFAALGKKEGEREQLSPRERYEFLSMLFARLEIWKPHHFEPALAAIGNKTLMGR